ncbi:MAG: hypothetical protein JNK43_10470 [Ignavibacteria bacterium]|nr:hypothetical protein [Ignavibacteria bacterium]
MFEKDYVMRMIKELGRVLAKIALLKDIENYTDAKTELNGLSKLVTGFEVEQLLMLGADGIKYVFGKNRDTEAKKIYCAARILKEEGLILEAEGKPGESLECFSLARDLFKMAAEFAFEEANEAISEIIELENKIKYMG